MPSEDALKNSIIELYQSVKIRKQSETKNIDKEFLEQEKISLQSVSPLSIHSGKTGHPQVIRAVLERQPAFDLGRSGIVPCRELKGNV